MGSIQRASVYARDDGFYLASQDRTVAGFGVVGAVTRLDADADESAFGAAIVSALGASRDGVPTPDRGARVAEPLVGLSSAKGWRAFAKAARLVEVERDGGQITFERWRHSPGRTDAFEPVPGLDCEQLIDADAAAIGAVTRRLLEMEIGV